MSNSDQEISAFATELLARADELGAQAAKSILRQVEFYGATNAIDLEELQTSVTANIRYVFATLAGHTDLEMSAAIATGINRARAGMPLHAVMTAYRAAIRKVWKDVSGEIRERLQVTADTFLEATERVVTATDALIDAMAGAYSKEQSALVRAEDERRNALVNGLLSGTIVDRKAVWEIADVLGLPTSGPYVAVCVACAEVGKTPMPGISNELRTLNIPSAWQLMPDSYLGIVRLRNKAQRDAVVEVLKRLATTSVGVSSIYSDLTRTSDIVRLARIAGAGRKAGPSVTVFDSAPLAIAAASDPEVMQTISAGVFGGLPDDERDMLLETLEAWISTEGSAQDAAAQLYCHPNTVRHRMHRIEKYTGKSFNNPRHVAELCLALEVVRRFS
ncbi:PucR family transcriptional regulator [Smaragdicoccus niigatensis]|uniref:PucR family transcriptional regulator n=1 Tax=Smaragdicoccus niigatensis TaxID=359359 RepID=UPI00037B99F7|nr:helix-turn-helix domain-containing protein [Smaragdicoccus niigatensis]